jgi:hypothetical protein
LWGGGSGGGRGRGGGEGEDLDEGVREDAHLPAHLALPPVVVDPLPKCNLLACPHPLHVSTCACACVRVWSCACAVVRVRWYFG